MQTQLMTLTNPAVTTFILVSIAELGDKTQLAAVALASRSKPLPVFIGSVVGFLLVNAPCVLLGACLSSLLSLSQLKLASGLMLVLVGILCVFPQAEAAEVMLKRGEAAFFTSIAVIATMEFADKTNVAVISLSASLQATAEVLCGVVAAAVVLMAAAVAIGAKAGRVLPSKWLRLAAAALFIGLGLYTLLKPLG